MDIQSFIAGTDLGKILTVINFYQSNICTF